MNIRNRMEAIGATTTAAPVAALTTVALLGAAGLHAAWARGSTWPRSSADELADLVVGRRPAPSGTACWAVAGLLTAAAASVASRGGRVGPGTLSPLLRIGARTTAGALLVRGIGGFVASGLGVGAVTAEFRRNDLRIYAPLCVALGAGATVAAA